VEAVARLKMQVDLQNGLAGAEHAGSEDQRQGQHARADGCSGHSHGAAQNGEKAAVHVCSLFAAALSGRV